MDEAKEPDWLTEMDEEILEVLSSNLILSPSIIAENIDRSREGVSNRLNSLQAGGLVKKVDRGKYRLTTEGEEVLFGEPKPERVEVLFREKYGVSIDVLHRMIEEELEKMGKPEDEEKKKEASKRAKERFEKKYGSETNTNNNAS